MFILPCDTFLSPVLQFLSLATITLRGWGRCSFVFLCFFYWTACVSHCIDAAGGLFANINESAGVSFGICELCFIGFQSGSVYIW